MIIGLNRQGVVTEERNEEDKATIKFSYLLKFLQCCHFVSAILFFRPFENDYQCK